MEKWSFKVRNNPKGISEKLNSSLGELKNVILDVNQEEKSVKFKMRQRLLWAFGINDKNNIIVNGEIFKTYVNNEANVEISFTQHPLAKLLIYGHIVLGLGFIIGLALKSDNNSYIFTAGGILFTIGIIIGLQKIAKNNFNKNVQEYKNLISRILEL